MLTQWLAERVVGWLLDRLLAWLACPSLSLNVPVDQDQQTAVMLAVREDHQAGVRADIYIRRIVRLLPSGVLGRVWLRVGVGVVSPHP